MTARLLSFMSLGMAALLSSCSWVDKGVGGNIPPRSADDAYELAEGGTLELLTYEEGVLGNDEDGGNRQLTARLVEGKGPLHAAVDGFTFNSDGTFTYVHNGDEPPSAVEVDGVVRHCDFFTYIANDGIDDGEPKDVCIDIKAVNDPPRIKAQRTISTPEDTPVTITPSDLLIEDPDSAPEELSVIVQSGDYYRLEQNTIHPAENYNGDLSVELTVSDGKAVSEPFTVTVKVISVNDPTVISQKVVPIVMDEDTAREITFDDLEVTDPDNVYPDDFTLTVSDGNDYQLDPPGSNRIRPDANYNGPLEVGITLTDKDGQTTGKTLTVQVNAVNDDPVAEGDTIQVDEGGSYQATAPGLLSTDKVTDVDGDDLTLDTTPVVSPQHGSLILNADGSWSYVHDGSETTSDSFTYRVTDGAGGEDTATVNITIIPINDPPTISGTPPTSVAEDTAYSFTPTASDPDAGDTLTFSITNKPSWAGFNTATGKLSGTPGNGDVGTTSGIVITVTDSAGASASLPPFNLTVTNVNDPPTISGTPPTSVAEDTAYSFTPTASDPDAGDTLTFSITNKPSWAGFNTATGKLSGTPGNGDVGTTSGIVITVTDSAGASASLPPFNLTVTNVNDPPTISGTPPTSVAEDTAYSFTPTASDPDAGDTLTFSITNKPSWAGFNTATGKLSGTPGNGDVGTTSGIVITVTDSAGASASLPPFNLTVTNVNDPPVAVADTVITNEDTPVTTGNVLANDTDPDGDTLSVSAADTTSAQGGTVVNNGNGTFTYTPAANFNGSDSFGYTVSDGNGGTAQGTVTIAVNAVNDAPVITSGQVFNVDENLSNTAVNPGPVQASDVDGDTLSYAITGNNPGGFIIDAATGQISTTAAFDYETQPTQYTLTIQVTDDGSPSLSATQDVIININDVGGAAATVNQPPLVSGVCEATPQNVVVANKPLNATDPDGDDTRLRFYRLTDGKKGNAVVDVTGRFTYTPHPGARGTDSFTYKVIDQQGGQAVGTVKIIIGETRIMPLGDAITAGSTDGVNVTSGYRRALRRALVDEGYAVEFVGSQSTAPDRHEGHLGSQVTTAYIAANVEGWLDANPADVVLLYAGTQDFIGGGDAAVSDARIGDILSAIDAWSVSRGQAVTVLLATIIDQWPLNPGISTFNDLLSDWAKGDEVIVVDLHGTLDYPADLTDGIHPNVGGYRKMADVWRAVLESRVLDRCP